VTEIDLSHIPTGALEAELARRHATPVWVGEYPPLREGRIHARCPRCFRRQTSIPRTAYDPPAEGVTLHFMDRDGVITQLTIPSGPG
jgi:hypothetical protein